MEEEREVLLKRLQHERVRVMDEARPEAVAKQHARGSLTARERLTLLLDPGSEFDEFGLHAKPVVDDYDAPADGVVTGVGLIHGLPYAVVSYDYTALGGSQGVIGHDKLARIFSYAERARIGIVILSEGGGARAQELGARYGTGSSDFIILGRLAGRVPIVGAAMGRAFAGHAILLSLCDFVVSTKNAAIGMAGPPLVETALGKKFTPEEIGPPEVHAVGGRHRAARRRRPGRDRDAADVPPLPHRAGMGLRPCIRHA